MTNEEILGNKTFFNIEGIADPLYRKSAVLQAMTAAREEGRREGQDPDFTLWVVVNKWQYDEANHVWYNNYINSLRGIMVKHAELYDLYLQNK